jgi:hypothetical protein
LLPSDLPPWQTVYCWFSRFRDSAHFEKINHALVMADRERVGREASPTAAIIDSQSVKATEIGGPLLQIAQPFIPFITHFWADGGYNHVRVTEATSVAVEIVKKNQSRSVSPFCGAAELSSTSCMHQSKQTSREELRGFNQICCCFPLCRLRNAARQTIDRYQ